jgi:hypothetical protein
VLPSASSPGAAAIINTLLASVNIINIDLPYVPVGIWHLKPILAFEAFTDPVDSSARFCVVLYKTFCFQVHLAHKMFRAPRSTIGTA